MSKSKRLAVPPDLLYLPLVGNYYRPPSAQVLMRKSKDDDLVFLKRDPNNPKDSNAIKVYCSSSPGGVLLALLGYVQRHAAARLTTFLNTIPGFENEDYVLGLVKKAEIREAEFEITPFGFVDKSSIKRTIDHHIATRGAFIEIVQKLRTPQIGVE